VLRTAFERWNRGDYEPRRGELHPDIEVVSRTSGRALQGHAGVRHWIADLNAAFARWQANLCEIHEISETRVIAVGRLRLHGRQSGVELDQPCAFIVDFRDGQIARLEAAPNRVEEVLAAEGVPPTS
jgi:ketosteroid isomerase-like protein